MGGTVEWPRRRRHLRPKALPPDAPIQRFDRVERIAHWVNAALFGVVMLTGSVLYIGQLSVLVGNREIVRTIHVYCGLAIPVAFLVAYLPRWGTALRRDFSRINRWTADDKRWFRTLGRDKQVRLGKFNAGQKLNAAFVVAAALVMVGDRLDHEVVRAVPGRPADGRDVRARLVRVLHLDLGPRPHLVRVRGPRGAAGDVARHGQRPLGPDASGPAGTRKRPKVGDGPHRSRLDG